MNRPVQAVRKTELLRFIVRLLLIWGIQVVGLLVMAWQLRGVSVDSLLTIDDDNSWYRNVVQRRIKRRKKPLETDVPGVLFLEIDGLARPVLGRAVEQAYVPTVSATVDELSAG